METHARPRTLLRRGKVVANGRVEVADVLLEGARILAVGNLGPGIDARVLDVSGRYVLPGLMDFHTHMDDRIGRFELADDNDSGPAAGLLNGITTVFGFVTQGAGTLGEATEAALGRARGRVRADITWHLTPTAFDAAGWRDLEAHLERGFRTIKLYTTYRAAGIYSSYAHLDEVFRRLAPRGVRFLIHCEDDDCIAAQDPALLDLARASAHGRLRPPQAEDLAVEHLLRLARDRGAQLHVVHVSTVEGARRIVAARADTAVSCETCPQYLWLDEGMLARGDGHRWMCSPPLRGDRETFRDLALAGAFDLYATDHCAFTRADKDDWDGRDVRTVANGLAGIGALTHLVWRLYAQDPDRAALEVARRLAEAPADLGGVAHRKGALRAGLDADVAVLDPGGPERPLRSSLADTYEPFPGLTSTLAFPHVFLRGREVVRDGALVPGEASGRPLVS